MPVQINDQGDNNRVIAPPAFLQEQHLTIHFTGSNNKVIIGRDCKAFADSRITLGDDCLFQCVDDCRLAVLTAHLARHAAIEIGGGCQFAWKSNFSLHEPSRIRLGWDCLIASGVELTTSDVHSVIDLASGQRINQARNITVGDHVWLGMEALILKGATIGNGCVIGARAVVTGDVAEATMAVGVPAKIVKRGVTWVRELI